MMKSDFTLHPISVQMLQEEFPADNILARESERNLTLTLARVDRMKFEALLQGHKITLQTKLKDIGSEEALKLFPPGPENDNADLPKLKMRELQLLEMGHNRRENN